MDNIICKKNRPPCPDDCLEYKRIDTKLCRKIPVFSSKTKYSKTLVLNKIKRFINPSSDMNQVLNDPKTIIYVTFRSNLTNEELKILPELILLLKNDIKKNIYKIDELLNIFIKLNLRQYFRDENNKLIPETDLDNYYNLFKLKGYSTLNSKLTNDLEALKLLEILLTSEGDFLQKYVESEVQPATPIKLQEHAKPIMRDMKVGTNKKKKIKTSLKKDSNVIEDPIKTKSSVEGRNYTLGEGKISPRVLNKPKMLPELPPIKGIKEREQEQEQNLWGVKVERRRNSLNEEEEIKKNEAVGFNDLEEIDLDEEILQSPSKPLEKTESRTYEIFSTLADTYNITKAHFIKFINLTRIKYYIKLKDRITNNDLRLAKLQIRVIRDNLEAAKYGYSNITTLEPVKQHIIKSITSNLPICNYIKDNNNQPASSSDITRYCEYLGLKRLDGVPNEIKCFLLLREIMVDEIEVLQGNFKTISYS